MRAHALILLAALAVATLAPGIAGAQRTDTVSAVKQPLTVRTFTLRNLSADAAEKLVRPYLQHPGAGVNQGPAGLSVLTVRETDATLSAIERLLAQFDRPPATLTFRFQLIVATEAPNRDPALSAVDPLLRDLFRFGGYRLLSQTAINASEGTSPAQTIGDSPDRLNLSLDVEDAQIEGTTGSVRIRVLLQRRAGNSIETLLSTGLTIPIGQTVVLGSAVADLGTRQSDAKALILTVQPEIAKIGR